MMSVCTFAGMLPDHTDSPSIQFFKKGNTSDQGVALDLAVEEASKAAYQGERKAMHMTPVGGDRMLTPWISEPQLVLDVKKKTRGKSSNNVELAAARQALNCVESRIKTEKYDTLPAHKYEFNMDTLQLDYPDLATLALKCFRKNSPTSTLMDHEIFHRLQVTQDNRLQVIVKKDFVIDDTTSPVIKMPPAGKGVSSGSKMTLASLQM
jgi:hypothetical protein